ncbi:MAG: type II secretion system F family protein, partial [Planctomycetes bacterium]|nr:type II secretion system F family protein [Planctomycetota bacterium]
MTIYLLLMILSAFLGGALVIIGFFKPVDEAEYEAAFRVNVDNLNRNTIFDVPEMQFVLWPFLQLAKRLVPPGERRSILRHLLAAGNPKAYSPDEYLTLCFLWGIVTAVILVAIQSGLMNIPLISVGSAVFAVIGFVAGYLLCRQGLAGRATRRLREISIQLPYALDLLSMTMQAGATFYEASKTVVSENPEEPLNQELAIVVREIEFGRSRQEALEHFGERIPVETLNSIIAAVLQAEQLGTPLAQVLLLQANLLRMYRS